MNLFSWYSFLSSFKQVIRYVICITDLVVYANNKNCSKNGVAIIRLDAIGDFIIWLDSAKEYRRLYPNKKITLIANAIWVDIAKQLPYWDEVWSVRLHEFKYNRFYRWKFLHRIRKKGFEIAIQPTFSRKLILGDSLIRASAAKQRIGSVGDLTNMSARDKSLSDSWYTQLLPAAPGCLMELDRNAEFISHLGCETYQASLPRLPVLEGPKDNFILPTSGYFIIFPGGSWQGKQWPINKFANLLVQLEEKYNLQVILCGSDAETKLCASIADESGRPCINLAGRTSLIELVGLIRGAKFLVGNDTSAVHIAAAVSTPTVCILGGGHYGRFMPYSSNLSGLKPVVANQLMDCYFCGWCCTQQHDREKPMPCIDHISVEKVIMCVNQALI